MFELISLSLLAFLLVLEDVSTAEVGPFGLSPFAEYHGHLSVHIRYFLVQQLCSCLRHQWTKQSVCGM